MLHLDVVRVLSLCSGIGDEVVGVARPRWTTEGRRLLYVRDDALWTLDLARGTPKQMLRPIAPIPTYVAGTGCRSNPAPPDAPYEAGAGNGLPSWESLVTWISRR